MASSFKITLLAILSLTSLISLSQATGFVFGAERLVVITKDKPNVGPINPADFVDPLHLRGLALGPFSAGDFSSLDVQSKQSVLSDLGINVESGVALGGGLYAGSFWSYFPFTVGNGDGDKLDRVVFDSANLVRGAQGSWYGVDTGNMIVFNSSGLIPGGKFGGKPYFPGGGMIYEYSFFGDNGTDWSVSRNRETFRCDTDVPAIQTPNVFFSPSDPVLDSIIIFNCKSREDGSLAKVVITNTYIVEAGSKSEWKHQVWTFK